MLLWFMTSLFVIRQLTRLLWFSVLSSFFPIVITSEIFILFYLKYLAILSGFDISISINNHSIFANSALFILQRFQRFVILLSETFLILRRIQRDIIIHVRGSSCKVPLLLSDFNETCNFLYRLSKITQISDFMKLRPVGVELFHADGQTDRHDEPNSRFSQFCGGS
jgi:hypothetical protein